jgi:hypothetical protein
MEARFNIKEMMDHFAILERVKYKKLRRKKREEKRKKKWVVEAILVPHHVTL